MDVLVFEEEEVEEEDEMRPATTTVEDDAASVVNIFSSCCFKEVFCVTFSTNAYFCFFSCFIDDISTKSSLRLWFSLLILCVLLFFLGA